MLGKIIASLCLGMFFYSYYTDGTVKDLVFWGVLVLFSYITRCTDIILEE